MRDLGLAYESMMLDAISGTLVDVCFPDPHSERLRLHRAGLYRKLGLAAAARSAGRTRKPVSVVLYDPFQGLGVASHA